MASSELQDALQLSVSRHPRLVLCSSFNCLPQRQQFIVAYPCLTGRDYLLRQLTVYIVLCGLVTAQLLSRPVHAGCQREQSSWCGCSGLIHHAQLTHSVETGMV